MTTTTGNRVPAHEAEQNPPQDGPTSTVAVRAGDADHADTGEPRRRVISRVPGTIHIAAPSRPKPEPGTPEIRRRPGRTGRKGGAR